MGRPKKESKPDNTFTINGVEFTDISNRLYITYEFATGRVLTINNPKGLYISPSGTNYVVTKDNLYTIVSPSEGWFIHWSDFVVDQPTLV
jgi:hypothetical protein